MKEYQTHEAIKMLTENPKLRFKRLSDGTILDTSERIENGEITGRYVSKLTNPQDWAECVTLSDKWTLIQQPILFLEAVQAYAEGKTIRCELEGMVTQTYKTLSMELEFKPMRSEQEQAAISAKEILKGRWFIDAKD